MTYQELVDWAKEKGLTEIQLSRCYASTELQAYREADDEELLDYLLGGGVKYDEACCKDHWENLAADDQENYRELFVEYAQEKGWIK